MAVDNKNMKFKITFSLVMSSLLVCIVLGGIITMIAKNAIIESNTRNLQTIRDSKIIEIKTIFSTFSNNIQSMSQTKFLQDALVAFESIAYGIGLELAAKDVKLDSDYYINIEKKFKDVFQEILDQYKMKNFYVVLNTGVVISQAKHDIYLGKNFLVGDMKNSRIAEAYKLGLKGLYLEDLHFSNELNKPVSYIAIPILSKFDRDGYAKDARMGVLIAELDWEIINSITKSKSGLGTTGEVYIVGNDDILRTDTLRDKYLDSISQKKKINTEVFSKKEESLIEVMEIKNYAGIDVFQASAIVNILNCKLALIIEKSSKEINASTKTMVTVSFVVIAIIMTLIGLVGIILGRQLANPFLLLTKNLENTSQDVLTISEKISTGGQQIATSSNQQAAATQESMAAIEQMSSMISQTTAFAEKSEILIKEVETQTTDGHNVMDALSSSMNLIQEATAQLQSIAEMIKDIARETNIINDIVFKTQLLSFNASIEAARAGMHGKGFSVVAEEVGNLARMSGEAAQQIHKLIENSEKQVGKFINETTTVVSKGKKNTDDALAIFQTIEQNVSFINKQVGQIFQASKEQMNGIQQTKVAIQQLDSATKVNVNVADESIQNAEALKDANIKFVDVVSKLKGIVLGSRNVAKKIAENATSYSINKFLDTKNNATISNKYLDSQTLDELVVNKYPNQFEALTVQDFENKS
ncbi:MAG: hypothetical protein A2381_20330 [Bdellovibrionales bacterium RIFOXYB1_FULL_37_110]|nr:MAG: hypothetical protein A2181_03965 [Bdellovibrionales bacterium RIFOXYA1_FULL_38_20]OFZ51083.1 MAG: hypothetical protein A2417_20115 [Bdellovibrionales bacterium RIFOXYC1_FULL_37_79]OFZ60295.1 MAG: hypothetical protein A2381_20330 [Bdellovibrionales bacterium RIFOXYB1_FULL_37_110]OFZ63290.1 MAG: hypothetical protein A2577_01645 [Bdellovibrionales bacterium RIFOXYD1_FULL_36_51]